MPRKKAEQEANQRAEKKVEKQDKPKRPRGRPNLSPEERKLKAMAKAEDKILAEKNRTKLSASRVAQLPNVPKGAVTDEEIRAMLGSCMRWFDKEAVRTDEECAERLNEFFESLIETGELPTVEKMSLALGVTRAAVFEWENGRNCSPARTRMIKRAKEMLAAMDAELVSKNKIPQVTYIFRAKNFHGMRDQTDVVVTPNNPIGAEIPEDELRKRITENVVVDHGEADAVDVEFYDAEDKGS